MGVFTRRRRKVLTPLVLASWLFAIAVSVAHACIVDDGLGQAGQSMSVSMNSHDGSDDGASPACQKFCSDDHPLLAKLKAVQDPPTGQALLAPALVGESFQIAAPPVPSLLPSPRAPPGTSLNIRFARLRF